MTLVSSELITQSSNDLENQSATQLKLHEAFKNEYGSIKFSD